MNQLVQNYKTGKLQRVHVPPPALKSGCILVETHASLVSLGTERSMLDLAKKSLIEKAVARPDLVKQVIRKIKTEGLTETYRQAMERLDTPVPLGYSSSGRVIAVGEGVEGFSEGDRVACAGSGHASHSEIVCVPKTLVVKIPHDVSFESAAFVALGSIAMHGIRMAGTNFGERVVVMGLGLLGQLAVQLLNAAGCPVCGLDIDPKKVEMALAHGAQAGAVIDRDDVVDRVRSFTDGHGADGVIILASTPSNDPIELAAEIARERGHIVVPGLVGLDIPRKTFYEKELRFLVSKAWGPGIHDPDYESGQDYPFPLVRWTAQRNMAHFIDLIGDGRVKVDPLITHRFPFEQATEAYDLILKQKGPVIGVILNYGGSGRRQSEPPVIQPRLLQEKKVMLTDDEAKPVAGEPIISIGLIGAGLFARGILLPAFKGIEGVRFRGVCTSRGISGEHIGRKNNFEYCTTDPGEIIKDASIDLVMVLTRHGSHAKWVCEALGAGKKVFVEKPLCINESELAQIRLTYSEVRSKNGDPPFLMVGFNRRFSPMTQEAIGIFSGVSRPLMITVRANVGPIAKESWVHDPNEGGGNIIGEVCHFVDLVQALTGSEPIRVYAQPARSREEGSFPEDNVAITLTMADGSVCTIHYTALGNKGFERERIEVFGGGIVCAIENFKNLTLNRDGKQSRTGSWFQNMDKGHKAEMALLISHLRKRQPPPVSFESYVGTTRATFTAMESLRTGKPVDIDLGF
jgi:predicted dehydrogenase/threonine dehydrogenase-like Zn-dependent dehydrogenase